MLYGFMWVIAEAIAAGAFITALAIYAAVLLVFQLLASLAMMVANAIVFFVSWVGAGVDTIIQAIGAQWNAIVKTVSPYVEYVANIFSKTVSEFGAGFNSFSETSGNLMSIFQAKK